jgi:cathepsin X
LFACSLLYLLAWQAHAAASVLADRIKIARGLQAASAPRSRNSAVDAESGPYQLHTDIALSVQFLLNCGANHSLSCHGGSTSRAYEFVSDVGFWPYETCQPYVACSSDSQEGFCPHVDSSCTPLNTCKTCMPGSGCVPLETFPNATVAEYGVYSYDVHAIMSEIFVRGPVKASVDAFPLVNYTGGVLWDAPQYRSYQHHHGVSLVGWGYDADREKQYWIARNSWGTFSHASSIAAFLESTQHFSLS